MSKFRETIETYAELMETLEHFKDCEPAEPEVGFLYRTFNNSVVYLFNQYDENEYMADVDPDYERNFLFSAVVLLGGHGIEFSQGEKPGEIFSVDTEGYFNADRPTPELVLSLREKLPINIEELAATQD